MNSLTKITRDPVYVGDTVDFTSTHDALPPASKTRVQVAVYDATNPAILLGVNAIDTDAHGRVSFDLIATHGFADWVATPAPAHLVATLYYTTHHGSGDTLATLEFDSPGSRP